MIEILSLILGSLIVLFIPGFTLVMFFFNDLVLEEKIMLSIGASMALDVIVAFILGGTIALRNLTGGFTIVNVFIFLTTITLITIIIGIKKWTSSK